MRHTLAYLLVAALAGCGDGGDGGDDGEECGHACPEAPINLPEGGEIRLELVHVDDGPQEVRTHAWLASEQTPATRPFPRDPANWKVQDGTDLCLDVRDMTKFPNGVPESRTYLDAGELVKFVGGGEELELHRAENVQDYANDAYHDIVYLADIDPNRVTAGTEYDFVIPGGGDVEAATYEGAIKIPEDYGVSFPDMSERVEIQRGSEYRFVWDSTSDDPYDFAFVAFNDLIGPVYFCIGPQTSYMTIPQEVIDDLPPGGTISQGLVHHRAIAVEGRRYDFVGINCKNSNYLISDAL